mgnify:CR=1 FL=1
MEMDLNVLMLITLLGMLLAIFAGVHIALALGATAMIGTYFIFEDAHIWLQAKLGVQHMN